VAVRHIAGILDQTVEEMKTRKLITMNCVFHQIADVDRLYVSRREGGRGKVSIKECVMIEEQRMSDYIRNMC